MAKPPPANDARAEREARLVQALRANLRKRKTAAGPKPAPEPEKP